MTGRDIGYRKDGKLIVAANDVEYDHLSALAASEAGLSMLSRDEARALEPMLREDFAGALWDPTEAQVDNRLLGASLVQVFLRAGGVLQANETVIRIETDGERVTGARTPFALYEADAYVLAAGAWSSRIEGLSPEIMPPVIPVKGEMIAVSGGSLPSHIIWGAGVYLISRAGRLLVGATASQEGFDTSLTGRARRHLLTGAVTLMPGLEKWEVADHWAGLRPGSPDGLPILGLQCGLEGLWVATGQYRNGILLRLARRNYLDTGTRHAVARYVAAFDPERFSAAIGLRTPGLSRITNESPAASEVRSRSRTASLWNFVAIGQFRAWSS